MEKIKRLFRLREGREGSLAHNSCKVSWELGMIWILGGYIWRHNPHKMTRFTMRS